MMITCNFMIKEDEKLTEDDGSEWENPALGCNWRGGENYPEQPGGLEYC